MYTLIGSEEKLNEIIGLNSFVLAYFSSINCAICNVLKPKIDEMICRDFDEIKLVEIKANETPEIPASCMIFTFPTIVLYADGRETLRESRLISLYQLEDKLRKLISLYNS